MKIGKRFLLGSCALLSCYSFSQNTIVNGTGSSGMVGIGTLSPSFMAHINGLGIGGSAISSAGWRNGIGLSNQSAICWLGNGITSNNFFMGYASSSPVGNFYEGFQSGIGTSVVPNYVSSIQVTTPSNVNPQGTRHFFKNVIIEESDGTDRFLGVNTIWPKRSVEIWKTGLPQLRLTHNGTVTSGSTTTGEYTDFQTTSAGDLNIMPFTNVASKNVGIHSANPTERIDVNGNARLRLVPTAVGNYLITGLIQGGVDDIAFRKIAFSGSTSQVLLGNGTWGPSPNNWFANNGLSVDNTLTVPQIQLGQNCSDPLNPAQLISEREIPMNTKNLYFTGQGIPTTNAIGLGYPACGSMPAKLNVLQENTPAVAFSTIAGSFVNRDLISGSGFVMTAVDGRANRIQPSGNNTNLGGNFIGANAPINIGIRGYGNSGVISASSYGGFFGATTTSTGANYGAYCVANGGTTNYAVYGYSIPGSGGTGPNYAGYFDGDVVGTAYVTPSDRNLKTGIRNIDNSLEILNKLNPVTYNYDVNSHKDLGLNNKKQYGFISQEVKEILPDLTFPIVYPETRNDSGKVVREKQEYLGLNYDGFIAILTDAVKQQQKEIEELKALVRSNANTNTNVSGVTLSDVQAIVLEQNVPNPFAEQTSISYSLPDGVQKAQILFYNAEGKLINSSELKANAGRGALNVFANDLSSGIYSYVLIVDGKIIDSKKMVKQ